MADMDSALKRVSAMNIGLPWRGIISPPDGTINSDDYEVYDTYYSGIASGAPQASPSPTGGVGMVHRHRQMRKR